MRLNFNNIYIFIFPLLFFSCMDVDCNALAESYRTPECILIVKNIPDKESVYNFQIIGRTIKTNKDTIYTEENRWFCTYYNSIDIGDTIIKRKGYLTFNIHKKDTVLSFNWECEGKTYN